MELFKRIRNDLFYIVGIGIALIRVMLTTRKRTRTFADVVEELAGRFGDRTALFSDAEALTYRALDQRANRYGRWAQANGVAKGDTVCLLMHNRPEFVAIWVGIARVGGARRSSARCARAARS